LLSEGVKDNAGDKSFEVIRFNPRDKLMESILLKFTREVLLDEPKGVLVIKEAPSDVNVLVILKSNPTELVTIVVVPGTKLMSNEIPPR
jgi:formylmethanofuran dehydrogenase subunit E-like metal-binding protein